MGAKSDALAKQFEAKASQEGRGRSSSRRPEPLAVRPGAVSRRPDDRGRAARSIPPPP